MRILRHASGPGPGNGDHFGTLAPTLRAAQPQRERLERHFPTDKPCEGFGLDLALEAARAANAHDELAETIVEFSYVREDARHGAHGAVVPATTSNQYRPRA